MSRQEIKNVAEFVNYVLWTSRGRNPIYRGHSNEKYELIPSIGRQTKYPDGTLIPLAELQSREKHVLEVFRGASVPFIAERSRTPLDVMVLAQHHGVPTRLLDWTTNPLTALYFAAKNANKNANGVVYVYQPSKSLSDVAVPNSSPFSIPEDCAFVPQHIDARVVSQFSVFTIHADPFKPMDHTALEQIWFAGEVKPLILGELEVLGVNARTIFPGLSGIGEHIRNANFGLF